MAKPFWFSLFESFFLRRKAVSDNQTTSASAESLDIGSGASASSVASSTSTAPALSPVAQKIEDHMATSPYAVSDPSGDAFAAGFHAAVAHLRALFPRL
jgi:hypothetical protein